MVSKKVTDHFEALLLIFNLWHYYWFVFFRILYKYSAVFLVPFKLIWLILGHNIVGCYFSPGCRPLPYTVITHTIIIFFCNWSQWLLAMISKVLVKGILNETSLQLSAQSKLSLSRFKRPSDEVVEFRRSILFLLLVFSQFCLVPRHLKCRLGHTFRWRQWSRLRHKCKKTHSIQFCRLLRSLLRTILGSKLFPLWET